jgi:hypothetical protein
MAKSDLLKEAIADAKAVKETALENAKIALQEAFMPQVEAMFAKGIAEELEDENEEMPVDDLDAPVDGEAGMDDEMPEEDGEGVNWIDNDLSFKVGGQKFDATVNNPESDVIGKSSINGKDKMDGEMDDEMDVEMSSDMEDGDDFGSEMEDEDELNLEAIIRELEGMDAEGELPEGMYAEDQMYAEGMYAEEGHDEPVEESIDEIIEAILREEYEDGDAEEDEKEHAHEEMKKELEEAYATVSELKNILSEVNLLNAKLLYTNKLFRNFELDESQKMKVIENFDRASNTREAKLVFTTLAESFKRPTKKRVVKESAASRATASTAPKKENTTILNEGFAQAERWKKLAGLL